MKAFNLLAMLILFLSIGCAKPVFDVAAKNKALNDTVFGENDGDNNHNVGENDNNNHNVGERDIHRPWNPNEPIWGWHKDGPLDSKLVCSDSYTRSVGYNLSSASRLEIRLLDQSGNIVCRNSNTAQIKSQIVDQGTFVVPSCANATALKYAIQLVDPSKSVGAHDLLNFHLQKAFVVRESVGSQWTFLLRAHDKRTVNMVEVLYAGNRDNEDEKCERRASPLVIKTDMADYRGVELTSQDRGIDFDILGERSNPYAHAKKRISWVTKSSYMFLVKPNKRGQVLGINEMFGDNTKGPDGQFATDGYHALAKYDLNKDRIIDKKDAVFRELALWSDKNFDGIAQRNELISLNRAGIEAIDLDYDGTYLETDQYGNQTTMKSVVKYKGDDNYRLIFDLWFAYEDLQIDRIPDVGIRPLPVIRDPARRPDIPSPDVDRVPRVPDVGIPRLPDLRNPMPLPPDMRGPHPGQPVIIERIDRGDR